MATLTAQFCYKADDFFHVLHVDFHCTFLKKKCIVENYSQSRIDFLAVTARHKNKADW